MKNIIDGSESLIQKQLNDRVIGDMEDTYEDIASLGNKFYGKRTITKKEYTEDFLKISKVFSDVTKERFGIDIRLRSSNTFAIMPLFNTNNYLDLKYSKDSKNAIKQLKSFNKFLETNTVVIDTKQAKISNIPKDYYFPLLINVDVVRTLKVDEFIAIVLHEIGHVFTLLELYGRSTKTISSIIDSLLTTGDVGDTYNKLGLTTDKVMTDKEMTYTIFDITRNNLDSLDLATNRSHDNTDIEFEADTFAVMFGYGDTLVKTLNKLSYIEDAKYEYFLGIGLFNLLLDLLVVSILNFVTLGLIGLQTLLLVYIAIDIISRLIRITVSNKDRNPSGMIHGDLSTRYSRVRTTLIGLIRHAGLDKNELKSIVSQIDNVDKQINILDKSFINSYFGGIISSDIGINLNLQDSLANSIDKLINNDMYVMGAKMSVGIEAVSYKGKKDSVVTDLIAIFKNITDVNIVKLPLEIADYIVDIEKLVYERFGIPVIVYPAAFLGIGWVSMPFNFIDDSALSDFRTNMNARVSMQTMLNMDANTNLTNTLKDGGKITIDSEAVKIHGLDRKKHRSVLALELGRDDLYRTHHTSSLALTPEEMAAITLHEIGHLFTYIDAMTRFVKTNYMLQDSLLNRDNSNKKSVVMYDERFEKADKRLNTVGGGIGDLVKSIIATGIFTIESMAGLGRAGSPLSLLMSSSVNKNKLGDIGTYNTDSEILADDFATMFGLGGPLTTGLKRIVTLNVENKLLILTPFIYYTVIGMVKSILLQNNKRLLDNFGKVLLYSIVGSITMWFTYFISRVILNDNFPYEKLPERFDGIKRSLIKVLREDDTLTKTQKKAILNSIEEIDNNYNSVIDAGYGSIIMSFFVPSLNIGIALKPNKILYDTMDKMLNNDLHILATKFEVGLENKTYGLIKHPLYSSIILSKDSSDKIDNIIGKLKDFDDDYHATLLYSTKEVIVDSTILDKDTDIEPIGATINGWTIFESETYGKSLVLKLSCKEAIDLHNDLMTKYNASYDYPTYIPHVTLTYNLPNEYIVNGEIDNDKIDTLINKLKTLKLTFDKQRFEIMNKVKYGNEAKTHFISDVSVFYTETRTGSEYISKLLNIKSVFKDVNTILDKYNIVLDIEKKKGILGVKSDRLLKTGSGISTIAFIDDDITVVLTLEMDKVRFQLLNPYVDIYAIDKVIVNENRVLYIMEMKTLKPLNDKKDFKITGDIRTLLNKHYIDHGITDMVTELDIIIREVKMSDILKEQFTIYRDYLIKNNVDIIRGGNDLHNGNIMKNDKGDHVLLDPIYNNTVLGHLQNNNTILDMSLLTPKDK